jgi:hypothetical protein
MKIHPKLKDKLRVTRVTYEKVTKFAELLPMFRDVIIESEITGECYHRLGYKFGSLYLAWGINWYTNPPTNYPEEKSNEVGFVNVYINCISLFGDDCYSFAHVELAKVLSSIKVHFYDDMNSTFYFLPSEVDDGLAKLDAWYIETKSKVGGYLKQKKKAELEKQLMEISK